MIEVNLEFIGNVEKPHWFEATAGEPVPSPGDEVQTSGGLFIVKKRRFRVDSSGIRSVYLLLKQKAWG